MIHTALLQDLQAAPLVRHTGRIVRVAPQVLRARGPHVELGRLCEIGVPGSQPALLAEVIASGDDGVLLMPYGEPSGVAPGAPVRALPRAPGVPVSDALIGRVVDAFVRPIDGRGPLPGGVTVPLAGRSLNPVQRGRVGARVDTGVKVLDAMLPVGRGQRVGVFAGSGVGKSTLLGMVTTRIEADVCVVALIGERSREVREFLEDRLGVAGLARSVVVVASADQPAVTRARAASAATAMAEYFRDTGRHVLLVMDSVTRLAMARREIDLAAGQPPTARGYTPGVFSALPALCERAGPGEGAGSITALYTVLVEGDDEHEPIADCLRATLDGHVWLARELAQKGQFPAVDLLRSVSRLATHLATPQEQAAMVAARQVYAAAERTREVVELGLYKTGTQPVLDAQLQAHAALERLFLQPQDEATPRATVLQQMQDILRPTHQDLP
ncbi:MAG TPA: FliI/YscN family ATPase [Burkholderiaceae bacterium]|nr:FliI/YscN family ATPase [Burkholderiaceae bacterium]